MIGNYGFIVYRLCKYTNENIQTFEIEDEDDPIELSDDEEDNVICLDSDGESIDIKEEIDLEMQLTWNFNFELKKELEDIDQDLDDLEARAIELKKEPADLQANENDEILDRFDEFYDIHGLDDNINRENPYVTSETTINALLEVLENDDSNDSMKTICFPTTNERSNDDADQSNDSTQTIGFGFATTSLNERSNDSENAIPLTDQTNNQTELLLKLKETVTKINETEKKKKKRRPATISAKPLAKRRKPKGEDSPPNGQCKSKTKGNKKEKLKVVASTSTPQTKAADEDKTHTTPKVKFTPLNRGAFLTDAKQMPVLPSKIQAPKRKDKIDEKLRLNQEKAKFSPESVSLSTIPTPPELVQKLWEDMYSYPTSQEATVQLSGQNSSTEISTDSNTDIIPMEIETDLPVDDDSGTFDSCPIRYEDEPMYDDLDDDDVDMNAQVSEENEEDENVDECDDDDDEDIDVLEILMRLPPETGRVEIIETTPKPDHIKSILKTSQSQPSNVKRSVTFKETGFQYDPRHKIISDVTAYDDSQFETVDDFCKKVDPDIGSFADSYEDYKEYRR